VKSFVLSSTLLEVSPSKRQVNFALKIIKVSSFSSILSLCLLVSSLSVNYFGNNSSTSLHISFWYLTSGIKALSSIYF
jgi:hypothetical protein